LPELGARIIRFVLSAPAARGKPAFRRRSLRVSRSDVQPQLKNDSPVAGRGRPATAGVSPALPSRLDLPNPIRAPGGPDVTELLQRAVRLSHMIPPIGEIRMKTLSVSLCVMLLVAFSSFAADQPQTPEAGNPAPAFSLPSQEGTPVSLDQYKGKWVVLYFYPKDFTSGCTVEAHNFQRDLDKYTAKNAAILGVSLDSVDSHKGFCTKEGLNFKLLSDSDHAVTEKYGSLMDHEGTKYAARNTFVIDPSGVIRKVYVKVKPVTHSEDVLADLNTLQTAK
jgi:peroxiredoxin Q/BCP